MWFKKKKPYEFILLPMKQVRKKILSQQNGVATKQHKRSQRKTMSVITVCVPDSSKNHQGTSKPLSEHFWVHWKQMLQQQQRTPFITENPGRQNFHWAITVNSTIIIRLTFNYLQMWWSTCHHLTWHCARRTLPECNYEEANEEILNDQQPYQNKSPTFFKTINV